MSVDADTLLGHLSPALVRLVADLSVRATDPAVDAVLRDEHASEVQARRTADPFEVWVDGRVVQIGAAWLLSLLFVRTLEDRGLLPPRLKDVDADHRRLLRGLAPFLTDTDYLLLLFRELCRHRAVRDVFDPSHNPVWTLTPSPDMASELLALCRDPARLGGLDLSGDTRFLGDVYERLDEGVRDRYALLQTPDFVESFILDRTLGPALAERGVSRLTLIDPTCGSGHFLLGAFRRLVAAWADADPGAGPELWATRALSQVYGVDLNPYAVAIARFRLVLAYLEAAGLSTLDASRDLRLNLAVADSLRPVEGARQQSLGGALQDPGQRAQWQLNPYAAAQSADAVRVLGGRSFDVVVGNPPYITVKDAVLREVYRELYKSAYREFQLVAPFTERFFGLANEGGWVGAIVGNGFMKREFGKKLIEEVLPGVDLTEVVDTSGAFIPGHGTPTVILFGRRRAPQGDRVLAVMGKRGEPNVPEEPAKGKVWASIAGFDQDVGHEDEFVSVDWVRREELNAHPWSLKGGGAGEIKQKIEQTGSVRLADICAAIGRTTVVGHDDVFIFPNADMVARRHPELKSVVLVTGDAVRDWSIEAPSFCVFPYRSVGGPAVTSATPGILEHFWAFRALLEQRTVFNKTLTQRGCQWFEHLEYYTAKLKIPYSITFAFVTTHNHFVLDRGGKVFNRSAPIIKLPPEATEDDHLALLGYLNSSTACFWMKQVFFDKGNRGEGGGTTSEAWERFYEFDSTKIKQFPLPHRWKEGPTLLFAAALDRLGGQWTRHQLTVASLDQLMDGEVCDVTTLRRRLDAHQREKLKLEGQIRWLQEELDWAVYGTCGLASPDLAQDQLPEEIPCLSPGTRPSDVRFARTVIGGETGRRYFELCRLPAPESVAALTLEGVAARRWDAIQTNSALKLIETPEYKRTFRESFRVTPLDRILGDWLLTRVETELRASAEPTPRSTRGLAQALHRDPRVRAVAELLSGHPDPDLEALLTDLTGAEAVPYLAAWRYKDPGLKKYRLWQRTWDAQRAEDAWESAPPESRGPRPAVPPPPPYDSGDFARPSYWSLRGKLDVPKERFIAYPGLPDDDDPTPLLGWAGWDHADRMAALGHLLERYGADPDRLTPILAGMAELQPWVDQWHGDDLRYGTPLGPLWAGHIDGALAAARLTREALSAWRPAAPTRGRKKR